MALSQDAYASLNVVIIAVGETMTRQTTPVFFPSEHFSNKHFLSLIIIVSIGGLLVSDRREISELLNFQKDFL